MDHATDPLDLKFLGERSDVLEQRYLSVGRHAAPKYARGALAQEVSVLLRLCLREQTLADADDVSTYESIGRSWADTLAQAPKSWGTASRLAEDLLEFELPRPENEASRNLNLMDPAHFRAAVSAGLDIVDATLPLGTDLSDMSLSGVTFANCRFVDVDFSGCRFDGPDTWFVNCTFRDCSWTGTLGDGARFTSCVLVNCDFVDSSLRGSRFLYSECRNVDFADSLLLDAVFASCRVVDTTFGPTCTLRGGHITDTAFDGATNLVGVQAQGARLLRCGAKNLNLGGAELQGSVLGFTDLTAAGFNETKLNSALIVGCKLEGADFRQARMRDVVFRNCTGSYHLSESKG